VTAAVLEREPDSLYDDSIPSYGILDLEELAERAQAVIAARKPFGFDTETGYHGESREKASLHAEENFVAAFQFTNSVSWSRMVPLAFDSGPNVDNKAAAAWFWQMLHAVDDEGLPLGVAHGAIAELRWLARSFLRWLHDHPLFGKAVIAARGYFPVRSCTMLEAYSEGKHQSNGLKALTLDDYGYQMRELADLQAAFLGRLPTEFEKQSVRFNVFNPLDLDVIAYACEDAVYALRHHLDRWPAVRNSFIYKLEMSVLPLIHEMADVGIRYDWAMLRAKAAECKVFADRLLAEVIEDFEALAGEQLPANFNLNSSKQLADLLYNKCKMPVLHYTDGGAPSVDAKQALPGLANEYPSVKKYLGWKKLHDLRTKFLEIYEGKYSWAPDGRAHPLLIQNGTITGRFSCEAINYQQSPGKYKYELRDGTKFYFNFRDAIAATLPGQLQWWELVLQEAGYSGPLEPEPLGWYILGFDLSQVELRALAAEAEEPELLDAFLRGEDVHTLTASRMMGVPLSAVSKEDRQEKGKRMNFAIGYGLSEHGMHLQTGKPIEECRELFALFHKAYPRLKPYTRRIIRESHRNGGVIYTKFGRRVVIWEYQSASVKVRNAGERTAGNCVIQGPATGDYVKTAMVRARKALAKAGLSDVVRPIMNVHDALEWEVRRDIAPAVVIAALKDAVIFPVNGPGVAWPPLVADWHMGLSWGGLRNLVVEPDGTVRLKTEADEAPPPPPEEASPAPAPSRPSYQPPPPQVPDGPPREVIVTLSESPTQEGVLELARYLKGLPGGNTVELRLPDDTSMRVPFACGLTREQEARVSVLLGFRATVRYAPSSADLGVLADLAAV